MSGPVKMSPLNTSAPVALSLWMATLWGVPASLLSNAIWKALPAGASTAVCSNAIPLALMATAPDPDPDPPELAGVADASTLGAGVIGGAGW